MQSGFGSVSGRFFEHLTNILTLVQIITEQKKETKPAENILKNNQYSKQKNKKKPGF